MKTKNIIILGGGGFIAKSLLEKITKKNNINSKIFLIDQNIKKFKEEKKYNHSLIYIKSNLEKESEINKLISFLKKKNIRRISELWNLCANSDIKISNLDNDLKNTYLSCFFSSKLLGMFKIDKYIFSSSSAIYGHSKVSLNEDILNFNPISMYGLMKLNCEKFLKYLSNNYNCNFIVLRFPNVIGPYLTHGVIFDFLEKAKIDKNTLNVLGNGEQKKPYLHVDELLDIIYQLIIINKKDKFNIFNISPDDNGIKVKEIALLFKKILYPNIKIKYSSKYNYGWKGDVPEYKFDISKIKSIGIKPKLSSKKSIINTLNFYKENIND